MAVEQLADTDIPRFPSTLAEAHEEISAFIDPRFGVLFRNCLLDPLQQTTQSFSPNGEPLTFIRTGDINAMWLRDSTHQIAPLVRFVREDEDVNRLVVGVINLQANFVIRDAYANAHSLREDTKSPHRKDRTDLHIPGVFERKWEPDSLASVIRLSHMYWKEKGDATFMQNEDWQQAMRLIYDTFRKEQRLDGESRYFFERRMAFGREKVPGKGYGVETAKVGLVHATHRPSDDACELPFNIPVNFMVAQSLEQLGEMFRDGLGDRSKFPEDCQKFSLTIREAIDKYGTVPDGKGGKRYVYETDALGHFVDNFDDPNLPGLLSSVLFGAPDDEVYASTRAFVLSDANKYFYDGTNYKGFRSPHTGKNKIWPLSIIMRALTSDSNKEIKQCLQWLIAMKSKDNRFNESVGVRNPRRFTRRDFGMANSMFAELILRLYKEHPDLLAA